VNANQLRACATWWHQIANESFIVFRTLEGWEAPRALVEQAHDIATSTRALATRFELEANKLEAIATETKRDTSTRVG